MLVLGPLLMLAGCIANYDDFEGEANHSDDAPMADRSPTEECGADGPLDTSSCSAGDKQDCTTPCGTVGTEVCEPDGTWAECIPPAEVCNSKDDDCDQKTDEGEDGKPLAQPCFCGSVQGESTCTLGMWSPCSAGTTQDEICDNLDNDCDALTDEGCDDDHDGYCDFAVQFSGTAAVCPKGGNDCDDTNPYFTIYCPDCKEDIHEGCSCTDPGATVSCFPGEPSLVGQGICQAGEWICMEDSYWSACVGYVDAYPEVCDGKDNDCDGPTDEDSPEGGGECAVVSPYGTCPGTYDCKAGKLECVGQEPGPELCDGVDNNCNGGVDEGFPDTDEDGTADCLE